MRHRECVSKVENFTENEFWSILDDATVKRKTAKRIIFCSGKLYFDLTAHREGSKVQDTAIIRIEQLYPLNTNLLKSIVANYPNAQSIVWCQEEPKNMGGWSFIAPRLMETLGSLPKYAGRRNLLAQQSARLPATVMSRKNSLNTHSQFDGCRYNSHKLNFQF